LHDQFFKSFVIQRYQLAGKKKYNDKSREYIELSHVFKYLIIPGGGSIMIIVCKNYLNIRKRVPMFLGVFSLPAERLSAQLIQRPCSSGHLSDGISIDSVNSAVFPGCIPIAAT
jgi:hypothetical protein